MNLQVGVLAMNAQYEGPLLFSNKFIIFLEQLKILSSKKSKRQKVDFYLLPFAPCNVQSLRLTLQYTATLPPFILNLVFLFTYFLEIPILSNVFKKTDRSIIDEIDHFSARIIIKSITARMLNCTLNPI